MLKSSEQDILLGVNIDHIATLRQARGTNYPDPLHAAMLAESAGADGITIHLREDRRHIQDRDLRLLSETIQTRLNLEMAVTEEMLSIAENARPTFVCLVPEKRAELTTEGGLDVAGNLTKITDACTRLQGSGILVSLFIDAQESQIEAAAKTGASFIELHTGHYADAGDFAAQKQELEKISRGARQAHTSGLQVNAGHGLHYHNVKPIAAIPEIVELNIGHAIVAKACLYGLECAVREMKSLMLEAR